MVHVAAQPTVLVVDDERDIRDTVAFMIEHACKARVLKADSAPQALAILLDNSVDLIVSDFKMPGMDGCQLLRHVKKAYPKMARILMTAYATTDLKNECKEIEVQAFLSKPFDPALLTTEVQGVLAK